MKRSIMSVLILALAAMAAMAQPRLSDVGPWPHEPIIIIVDYTLSAQPVLQAKHQNPIPTCSPCPFVQSPSQTPDPAGTLQLNYGMSLSSGLQESTVTPPAHGPSLPPDPWAGTVAVTRLEHGPTMPPDPWCNCIKCTRYCEISCPAPPGCAFSNYSKATLQR